MLRKRECHANLHRIIAQYWIQRSLCLKVFACNYIDFVIYFSQTEETPGWRQRWKSNPLRCYVIKLKKEYMRNCGACYRCTKKYAILCCLEFIEIVKGLKSKTTTQKGSYFTFELPRKMRKATWPTKIARSTQTCRTWRKERENKIVTGD